MAKERNISLQFFRDGGRERGDRGQCYNQLSQSARSLALKNKTRKQHSLCLNNNKKRGEESVCGFVQMLETTVLSSWRNEGKELEE